jgi:hypothetical protein
MKAQRGRSGTAPLLKHGTRYGSGMINYTPVSVTPNTLNRTKGGHYGWSERFAIEKILLTTARNCNPYHPACSLVTIVTELSQLLTILISKSKTIYSLTHTL